MMEKKKLLMVFSILLLTMAIGFQPSPAIGAKKYVTYLGLEDFTGPIAGITVSFNEGIRDHFVYMNEQGGIDGVTINPILLDTRYDTARAVSAFKRYRREHKLVFILIASTGVGRAMYPLTVRDKVPIQVPGVGYFQHLLGWAITYAPPYQDMFGASLDWMVDDWKSKGNPGMPVVGYMGWDNAMGRENMLGGMEYAEKLGVKLLEPEYYTVGSLKHDVWLSRLRDKGAKYIFISGTDPENSNVVRDAYALGMSKDVQLISGVWGTTIETGVAAHPEEFEGEVICSPGIRGVDARAHPLAQLWKQLGKSQPTVQFAYLIGMAQAIMFEKALKVALQDVGYEKVNGEAVYKALQKITGEDTKGITGPIDLSPTSRRVTRDVKFYRVSDGAIVPITRWRRCPDTVSLHKWE
jgi:ABC-type branched-subunit amino acid transport system substrate-binding protein